MPRRARVPDCKLVVGLGATTRSRNIEWLPARSEAYPTLRRHLVRADYFTAK